MFQAYKQIEGMTPAEILIWWTKGNTYYTKKLSEGYGTPTKPLCINGSELCLIPASDVASYRNNIAFTGYIA